MTDHDHEIIIVGAPAWPLLAIPLALVAYVIFACLIGG